MKKEIIQYLKESNGYISGEDISRSLKISRAGIWKYMQELRKEGYDIVAVPHLGYQLKSVPDKLLPNEILYGLKTAYMGQELFHYDSLPSTMDTAFELAVQGKAEGTLVCAENQTKGKGRLGRQWSSPKGKGIYMSLILRPALSPMHVSQLTLLSAVAVCDALREMTGYPLSIKWPNDLLIEGKKVAGILTEMSAEMDRVRFVVVGIGINVNTPASSLPEGGTSLKHFGSKQHSRIQIVQNLLNTFEAWYDGYCADGFDKVIEQWKKYSSTLGQQIRIQDQNGELEGEAIDLDPSGGLMVKTKTGTTIKYMSGDVIPVS